MREHLLKVLTLFARPREINLIARIYEQSLRVRKQEALIDKWGFELQKLDELELESGGFDEIMLGCLQRAVERLEEEQTILDKLVRHALEAKIPPFKVQLARV